MNDTWPYLYVVCLFTHKVPVVPVERHVNMVGTLSQSFTSSDGVCAMHVGGGGEGGAYETSMTHAARVAPHHPLISKHAVCESERLLKLCVAYNPT